jgi:hypothetical protein
MGKAQRGSALEAVKARGWNQVQTLLSLSRGGEQGRQQQQREGEAGAEEGGSGGEDVLQGQQGGGEGPTSASNSLHECAQTGSQTGLGAVSYTQYVYGFNAVLSQVMRALVLGGGARPDGRQRQELRPLGAKGGYLPAGVVHGSALFSRGETQALCVATVGGSV